MKTKKKSLYVSLSIITISLLISSLSLTTFHTKALLNERKNYNNTNYIDRYTWKWTPTEVVSTESTDNSNIPSLAVDSEGNIHIAWLDHTDYAGSGADYDIFYKRWEVSNSSWTTTEVVSTESNRSS